MVGTEKTACDLYLLGSMPRLKPLLSSALTGACGTKEKRKDLRKMCASLEPLVPGTLSLKVQSVLPGRRRTLSSSIAQKQHKDNRQTMPHGYLFFTLHSVSKVEFILTT